MSFTILAIANKSLVAGKLVDVSKFLVVDENGEPVLPKFFDTEVEAQAQIDGLGNLSEGLAFAKAQFPEQADKAQKGKGLLVAAYLDWIANGRPVKEVLTAVDEEPATGTEAEPAPAPVEEEF